MVKKCYRCRTSYDPEMTGGEKIDGNEFCSLACSDGHIEYVSFFESLGEKKDEEEENV